MLINSSLKLFVLFFFIAFGTGTNHCTANKSQESGGGGGGAKMEPSAILVIKGDRIELFNIKGNPYSSSFDRLIGLVPDLVSKLKSDEQ